MYNVNYLVHHGIKGQKWGLRRYQNSDGSLTEEGKERYSVKQRKQDERLYGRRAAKRIEERVNNGETLVSARHQEVLLKQQKEKTKQNIRKVTKPIKDVTISAIGAVAMAVGLTAVTKLANNEKISVKDLPRDTVELGKRYIRSLTPGF